MFRATAFMAIALARPSTVGAIMPSSRHLADAATGQGGQAQQAQSLDVGVGVEPLAAICARRRHGTIASLPDAQEVGGQAGTVGDDADGMACVGWDSDGVHVE